MGRQGFTLLETLLVMFVISLLLIITQVSLSSSQMSKVSEQVIVQEIKQGLKYAQQRAVLRGELVRVSGRVNIQQIQFKGVYSPVYDRIILDEDIRLKSSFELEFLRDGRIGSYQSINFLNTQTGKEFRLAIQLGNGQFEVQ